MWMIYRIVFKKLNLLTISFRINGKLIPGGFLGWVNTKVNYLEVTFIAKSYNYGFDMEWRCSSSNESILDSAAIQQTFSIFSSFRIPDPAMKTFTEVGSQNNSLD